MTPLSRQSTIVWEGNPCISHTICSCFTARFRDCKIIVAVRMAPHRRIQNRRGASVAWTNHDQNNTLSTNVCQSSTQLQHCRMECQCSYDLTCPAYAAAATPDSFTLPPRESRSNDGQNRVHHFSMPSEDQAWTSLKSVVSEVGTMHQGCAYGLFYRTTSSRRTVYYCWPVQTDAWQD